MVPLTSGGVFSVQWTAEMAFAVIIGGLGTMVIAIFARRGLWGTVDEKFNIRLFPIGYHLWANGERGGRRKKVAASAS